MVARVAAVPLLTDGTLDILGMTKISDTSSVGSGSTVSRTIMLNVGPVGQQRFPTDGDKIAATTRLCKSQLELNLASVVRALTPVVT